MNTNDDKKIRRLRKVMIKHYKDYYSKLLDEGQFDERIPEFKYLREKNNDMRNSTIITNEVIDNS
jgi:CRISPR/Cas system endoribonuclease Cas6 (RAMP superfamily)